jgi:hypothetical protein
MKTMATMTVRVAEFNLVYTNDTAEWQPTSVRYRTCDSLADCWKWIEREYKEHNFKPQWRKGGASSWRSNDWTVEFTISYGNQFHWEETC